MRRLEELQRRVNEQCQQDGLPPAFTLPEREVQDITAPMQPEGPQKWRICQNFNEVNRHTIIAPMPQGDIRAKQQRLSGHKYVSVFDFASGFYAVEVPEESRPFTAFYVEGRGWFWYKRMPMGLTGAPSTFADMTATHLHDLIADGTMEPNIPALQGKETVPIAVEMQTVHDRDDICGGNSRTKGGTTG